MALDKAQVEFTITVSAPFGVRPPVTAATDDAPGRCSAVAWLYHPGFGIILMPSTPVFQGASVSSVSPPPGGRG